MSKTTTTTQRRKHHYNAKSKETSPHLRAQTIRGLHATEIFVNESGDVCIKQPEPDDQDSNAVLPRSDQLLPVIAALQALYACRAKWETTP